MEMDGNANRKSAPRDNLTKTDDYYGAYETLAQSGTVLWYGLERQLGGKRERERERGRERKKISRGLVVTRRTWAWPFMMTMTMTMPSATCCCCCCCVVVVVVLLLLSLHVHSSRWRSMLGRSLWLDCIAGIMGKRV